MLGLTSLLMWLLIADAHAMWRDSSAAYPADQLATTYAEVFLAPEYTGNDNLAKLTAGLDELLVHVTRDGQLFNPASTDTAAPANCYLVTLRDDMPDYVRDQWLQLLGRLDGHSTGQLDAARLKGHRVCFPDDGLPLAILQRIPWVRVIERDQVFHKSQVQQNPDWALALINNAPADAASQEDPDVSQGRPVFGFDATGSSALIYLVDSGIDASHPEFGPAGRVKMAHSVFERSIGDDCDGHGTKVGSLAVGLSLGVAKQARIRAVQVLDCQGNGATSSLIEAIGFILQDYVALSSPDKVIVNLSLGGPKSVVLDLAVNTLTSRNITVVVAAGNESVDACAKSPAGNPSVITVGSVSKDLERASFSNYGQCIDIFAPGKDVRVAAPNDSYTVNSGTSLSAPFVSGVLALHMDLQPHSSAVELKQLLYSSAQKDVLDERALLSPNILLKAPRYDPSARDVLVPIPSTPQSPPSDVSQLRPPTAPVLLLYLFLLSLLS